MVNHLKLGDHIGKYTAVKRDLSIWRKYRNRPTTIPTVGSLEPAIVSGESLHRWNAARSIRSELGRDATERGKSNEQSALLAVLRQHLLFTSALIRGKCQLSRCPEKAPG
jgi:hypothetical protein